MKVVLFCGGYGLRMREGASDRLPKPMALIGDRPLLWHVMRYYAHFGHREFILCLGYGAGFIKDYFLHYEETCSNDFVLDGANGVQLLGADIADWRITFVNTGRDSSIGERLYRVREHLGDDEVFLANYGDVLTDLDLPLMVDEVLASGCTAGLLAVRPRGTFHCVTVDERQRVAAVRAVDDLDVWVNGGYFVLRQGIFDHLGAGLDLVDDAFGKLMAADDLFAYRYEGFWRPSDTYKDRQSLDELYQCGSRPWAVWERRCWPATGERRSAQDRRHQTDRRGPERRLAGR